MSSRKTLFVAGFGARTRARDLAYEFERYGRLVRCDIPAPKSYTAKVYAFVEFEDPYDAEEAYNEMHGRCVDGYTISVQWARKAPNATWRLGPSHPAPAPPPLLRHIPPPSYHHHHHPHHRRSYSPYHSNSRERPRSSDSPPRGRSPPYNHHHYIVKEKRYSLSHSRSRSPITTAKIETTTPPPSNRPLSSPTSYYRHASPTLH